MVVGQLEQRVERSHGTNFDRLLREAREQSNGLCLGSGPGIAPFDPSEGDSADTPDSALGNGSGEMARAGLEPATPRFSASRRGSCEGVETALESGMSGRGDRRYTRGCGRIRGGLGLQAGLESNAGRDRVRIRRAALTAMPVGRQGRSVMWRAVQATNSCSLISRLARRSTISAASSSDGRCQCRSLRAMNSRMQM